MCYVLSGLAELAVIVDIVNGNVPTLINGQATSSNSPLDIIFAMTLGAFSSTHF